MKFDWLDWKDVPKDGRIFLFTAKDSGNAVFLGTFRDLVLGNVTYPNEFAYISYLDTRDKNYFRSGAFIKCGLEPLGWMELPESLSRETERSMDSIEDAKELGEIDLAWGYMDQDYRMENDFNTWLGKRCYGN